MTVVITDTRTEVDSADTTTGWSSPVKGESLTLFASDPVPAELSNCIGMAVSEEVADLVHTLTGATDLSDVLVYAWTLVQGTEANISTGGRAIVLLDAVTPNEIAYHLGGSDVAGFRHNDGPVGWQCLLMDVAVKIVTPGDHTEYAGTEAALDHVNITGVGTYFDVASKALGGADNCFTDVIRYGNDGLVIAGGTTAARGTFTEIATEDSSGVSGTAYGICHLVASDVFGLQGPLTFGLTATNAEHWFQDINKTVVFEDRNIGTARYFFDVVGNSTDTQHFQLGLIDGTENGTDGCFITIPPGIGGSMTMDDADLDFVGLYGSSITGFDGGILLCDDATNGIAHDVFDCTFTLCGQINPGRVDFKNNAINLCSAASALLLEDTDNTLLSDLSFLSSGAGHAIEITGTGSYTLTDFTYSGYDDSDLNLDFERDSGETIGAATIVGPTLTYTGNGGTSLVVNSSGVLVATTDGQPRFNHDLITGAALGILIEEERTNVCLGSAELDNDTYYFNSGTPTITQNHATAPDGNTAAERLEGDGDEGRGQNVTISGATAGRAFTATYYAKATAASGGATARIRLVEAGGAMGQATIATVDLAVGETDWERIVVSGTITENDRTTIQVQVISQAASQDFLVWGVQLEQAAFPTSHIPTTTVAVTRTADGLSTTDLTWLNANAGTMYVEGSIPFVGTVERSLFTIDDGGVTDRLRLYMDASENINFETINSADDDGASDGAAVMAADTTFRVAAAYADDDVISFVDGTTSGADSTAGIPVTDAATTTRIGDDSAGTPFNGHISRVKYWNFRQADPFLEDTTASLFSDETIFNDSGGAVTLTISGGDTPTTIRNGGGASTIVIATVSVNVHVEDTAGADVEFAQVSVHRATVVSETSGAGNTAQDPDLVITGSVPSDQPPTGYITVNDRSLAPLGTQGYRYASHAGSTFTFLSEVTFACTGGGSSTSLQDTVNDFTSIDIEEGDTIRNDTDGSWAMVDEIVDADNITTSPLQGGSDDTWTSGDFYSVHQLATTLVSGTDTVDMPLSNGQTDSNGDAPTLTYDSTEAPTAITIRVRFNSGATKYIPFKTSGTISATDGLTLNVVLQEDTVAT